MQKARFFVVEIVLENKLDILEIIKHKEFVIQIVIKEQSNVQELLQLFLKIINLTINVMKIATELDIIVLVLNIIQKVLYFFRNVIIPQIFIRILIVKHNINIDLDMF